MKEIKIILLIIYMSIIMLFLCGCSNKEETILNEKVESEIQYLDKRIVGIMNKLNNITLENYEVKSKETSLQEREENSNVQEENGEKSANNSTDAGDSNNNTSSNGGNIKVLQMQPSNILVIDKNDIDWITIKSEIEIMYSTWNTILMDLYSINVENSDIINFSKALDDTILVAKEENKLETLKSLANLYSYLPKYMDKLSLVENSRDILQTKSYILNAYALVEEENWSEVQNQMNLADETYSEVINDVKYIENNQGKASRVYVLIKEIKSSINLKDKDIFYIKYKNLMNSIQ